MIEQTISHEDLKCCRLQRHYSYIHGHDKFLEIAEVDKVNVGIMRAVDIDEFLEETLAGAHDAGIRRWRSDV